MIPGREGFIMKKNIWKVKNILRTKALIHTENPIREKNKNGVKTFLGHIAKHLINQYPGRLEQQCIVFPNRRAGLYFIKYLSSAIEKPVFAPAVKTINELFSYVSPLLKAENELLVFELYRTYRELNPKAEPFDTFYFWGEMLLNDFDDVDKYLVDPGRIFANLSDLKKIDSEFGSLSQEQIDIIRRFWINFNAGNSTDEKKNFAEIWTVLPQLFRIFRENLIKEGIAYEGMIFREVAEKCIAGNMPGLPWETFHFVGFNALNKCEKILLKYLRDSRKAKFYWDYDESYIAMSSSHSAGYFIKENIGLFGNDMPEDWNYKTFLSSPPENLKRKIISTASDIAQVKLVPDLLNKINEINGEEAHHTAIILADENLLVPLLSSIPESVQDVNITMGYPLKFSQVYSFLKMLLALQKNSRTENGVTLFSSGDVTGLLRHSYMADDKKYHGTELLSWIISEGKQWIPSSRLCITPELEVIFKKPESPAQLPAYIRTILEKQYLTTEDENPAIAGASLHNEFIFRALQVLNRLERIVNSAEISMTVATWSKLFDRVLRGLSVPFSGEPLSGIQIMGLLETRALDFKNIIILSVNEDRLPRSSAGSSFIPHSLREAFGLPVIRHQDSIYSYYFYRLLHRAENAAFIYNSNAEGLKTGEMSRLLMQLNYLSGTPPIAYCHAYEIDVRNPLPQVIARTEQHQKILENKYFGAMAGNISPRAINTWLTCRMQFYYRYVCGLEEPAGISAGINPAAFGSLLHQIMQKIYSGFIDRQLTKTDIEKITGNTGEIERTVRETITEKYHATSDDSLTGSEQIVANILGYYVKLILAKDNNFAPLAIKGLEQVLHVGVEIENAGKPATISVGGTIDRIDLISGRFRILDYKTGDISMKIKSLESLFDEKAKSRPEEWLQVLVYCEVFFRNTGSDVFPAIYTVRQLPVSGFTGMLTVKDNGEEYQISDYSRIRDRFSSLLTGTLSNIFNINEPFRMTEDRLKCRFCSYCQLCGKNLT